MSIRGIALSALLLVGFGLGPLTACCTGEVCACEAEFEDIEVKGSVTTEELQAVVEAEGVETYQWLDCEPVCMAIFRRDIGGDDAESRECNITFEPAGEGAIVDCLVRSWGSCS